MEMPKKVARLPRQGGLPVPYVALQDKTRADFRVLDTTRVERCLNGHRCGICSSVIDGSVVFIGGPASMFSNHQFRDPPMHEECARYAAGTCPFLSKGQDYREGNLPPTIRIPMGPHTRDFLGWSPGYEIVWKYEGLMAVATTPWLRVELIGRDGEPNREVAWCEVEPSPQDPERGHFLVTLIEDGPEKPQDVPEAPGDPPVQG